MAVCHRRDVAGDHVAVDLVEVQHQHHQRRDGAKAGQMRNVSHGRKGGFAFGRLRLLWLDIQMHLLHIAAGAA